VAKTVATSDLYFEPVVRRHRTPATTLPVAAQKVPIAFTSSAGPRAPKTSARTFTKFITKGVGAPAGGTTRLAEAFM